MADRPILFSGSMIRALLDGRKTQTRRILKPLPNRTIFFDAKKAEANQHQSPRFETGDRLWVRETWQALSFGDYQPSKSSQSEVRFAATDPCAELDAEARGYPWRPSIFMPRWASRLTLTVTDVRVERLHDITNEDCIAEGVPVHPNENAPRVGPTQDAFAREHGLISHYGAAYRRIWQEINGKASWDANPWIVAYTFTVEHSNIDQIARAA